MAKLDEIVRLAAADRDDMDARRAVGTNTSLLKAVEATRAVPACAAARETVLSWIEAVRPLEGEPRVLVERQEAVDLLIAGTTLADAAAAAAVADAVAGVTGGRFEDRFPAQVASCVDLIPDGPGSFLLAAYMELSDRQRWDLFYGMRKQFPDNNVANQALADLCSGLDDFLYRLDREPVWPRTEIRLPANTERLPAALRLYILLDAYVSRHGASIAALERRVLALGGGAVPVGQPGDGQGDVQSVATRHFADGEWIAITSIDLTDAGAERVGLDLWTYHHDDRAWFVRITDHSDHGVPTDDPQIGGEVVVSSHAPPVVGEVTGTHPEGGASAALDALTKAGDAGFRARIVAFGRFLAPEGTDVARIAAVATALAAPPATAKKWWYGHATPRGAAASAVLDRIRTVMSA